MIKILQFGEGNFLRTFVDLYFDTLNKEGVGDYKVSIIKPIVFGSLDKFKRQDNKYHVILRGVNDGKVVEDVYKVDSVAEAFSPFEELDRFYSLALDKELKIIVSNTTEAGIVYKESDNFDGFEEITYPAKLTKFLYKRYLARLDGVYILPVELIDDNGDELFRCVCKYISLWNLEEGFKDWILNNNYFCSTLVDRIVSGYPKTDEVKEHLESLIGEKDELMSIGEPFGLWVIEKKGEIERYIKEGVHNINVILSPSIKYYKKRKVRVLNGSHTNLVALGLLLGKETVYDCMVDEKLSNFVEETLEKEIIPYVSDDIDKTREFASSVKDRFLNPYLNHQLISISLNSISKWRARDLPTFKDYYDAKGEIPKNLTMGFASLMGLYKKIYKEGDRYLVNVKGKILEIKDDKEYLEYFANGGCVIEFMKRADVFGEDLTKYEGFPMAVKYYVKKIKAGEDII